MVWGPEQVPDSTNKDPEHLDGIKPPDFWPLTFEWKNKKSWAYIWALWPQHSWGRGRRITTSSRPAWAMWRVQASQDYIRLCFKLPSKNKQTTNPGAAQLSMLAGSTNSNLSSNNPENRAQASSNLLTQEGSPWCSPHYMSTCLPSQELATVWKQLVDNVQWHLAYKNPMLSLLHSLENTRGEKPYTVKAKEVRKSCFNFLFKSSKSIFLSQT